MKTLLLGSGLIALALAIQPSLAQTAAGSAGEGAVGLQEVIVTAQKRAENVQDVPISMVVFTGDNLKQLNITEAFDLPNQIPNMNVDTIYGDSNVRYFLRGVGSQDTSTLATSPIALYIDDIYLGSGIGNSIDLFDMERVEVLMGPQGTLWGRNTTGGAINFISAHPTQSFASDFLGSYGRYGDRIVDGMVNMPLTSTLAARVAFTYSGRDAWVKNLDPAGPQNFGAYNKAGGRLSFEWTPNDAFTAYLRSSYLKRTGGDVITHMVPINGKTDIFGDTRLPIDEVNQGPGPAEDDFETWDISLRMEWKLGFATLISITGVADQERIREYDIDGGAPVLVVDNADYGNSNQFSQELRLVSESPAPFRWQAGVYYQWLNQNDSFRFPFNDALFGFPPGFVSDNIWPDKRKFNSSAAFGGIEYDLTRQLTAKAGLRYTADEGSYHAEHYSVFPYANYLKNYVNPNPAADPNAMLISGDTINAQKNWSKLTWDTGLRYHLSDSNMVYLNASTGYRQGTFNTPAGGSKDGFTVLNPETNLAFELGLKSSWLDGRVQLNAAAFDYEYKNMQVFAVEEVNAFGETASIEANAGRATDRGGEIQLKAVPAMGWLASASVGYVHAIFTEFNYVNMMDEQLSYAGNLFPRQPQWTASALLEYQFHVGNGDSVTLHTDWNFRGNYYVNVDNVDNPSIPSRTIGNVRATYAPQSDRWSVALWAKNVTNKNYPIGGYTLGALSGSSLFVFGDPLTYGISGTVKF